METLVNDKMLQERSTVESDAMASTSAPSTSRDSGNSMKTRQFSRGLNVSGPVPAYSAQLKNFWYPVAFSADLKDDTMVNLHVYLETRLAFMSL